MNKYGITCQSLQNNSERIVFYSVHYDCWRGECRLDQDTGILSTNGRLRPGHYNVRVRVYDIVWKREVVSSVSVVVKEISDDAIANAGTVRLQGI